MHPGLQRPGIAKREWKGREDGRAADRLPLCRRFFPGPEISAVAQVFLDQKTLSISLFYQIKPHLPPNLPESCLNKAAKGFALSESDNGILRAF